MSSKGRSPSSTPRAERTAQRFRRLNFHDDTLIELRVLPSHHRRKKLRGNNVRSVVELCLYRYWENTYRVIRFHRCANLRVAVDFDVLADNLPPNTSYVDADTNKARMRRLIKSQELEWGVTYEVKSSTPIPAKLLALDELVSFRVQFFGGVVDVMARRYEVVKKSSDRGQVA
jgi:hypothetical protein